MKKTAARRSKESNQTGSEVGSVEKYLTFFIESQLYAIPSSQVVEIIRMQPITLMPKMPPFVKGIINLRGKIVPLVDLCLRFGKETKEYDDRTSIIVVSLDELNVGLIVEAVNDVTDIAQNQISKSPSLSKGTINRYVNGIATLDNEVAMLMDLTKVLIDKQAEQFNLQKSDLEISEK